MKYYSYYLILLCCCIYPSFALAETWKCINHKEQVSKITNVPTVGRDVSCVPYRPSRSVQKVDQQLFKEYSEELREFVKNEYEMQIVSENEQIKATVQPLINEANK